MSFMIDPADFAGYGVTNASPLTHLSDLREVSLHRIFRYENFSRPYPDRKLSDDHQLSSDEDEYDAEDTVYESLPRAIWERALPAFRLATLFVNHSSYYQYCIRNSPVMNDAIGLRNRPKRYFKYKDPNTFTQGDLATINMQLEGLADRIRFHLQSGDSDTDFAALSGLATDWFDCPPTGVRYLVQVKHFIDFIGSNEYVALHHSTQMRAFFQFALTLVHELAHLLYWERFPNMLEPRYRGHDIDNDPYWDLNEARKEVGYAWENLVSSALRRITGVGTDWFSDINLPDALGHAMPVQPIFISHTKARLANAQSPYAPPSWHIAKSESVEKFFDMTAWQAFDQYLADPGGHENPLQLQLIPPVSRVIMEVPDGSGMSALTTSDLPAMQDNMYMGCLRLCFQGPLQSQVRSDRRFC